MKKALLATLIGATVASGASAAVYDFSYASGELYFDGYSKKQTYDIAIFLPGDTFGGMKITSISAPVNADNGGRGIGNYQDPSVWLSSELLLDSKKNAPNIASYSANIDLATDDSTLAYISYTLPEAYTIPAEGVYVGYSFEVKALDAATKYPIAYGAGGAEGSFYVHATSSVKQWTAGYEDGTSSAIVVGLDADNLPAANVSFSSIPSFVYLSLNEPKTVTAKLISTASEPVSSVDFEFTLGGNAQSCHYELAEPVSAGIYKAFNASFEIPAQSALGSEEIEVKVAKVNGKANSSEYSSASTEVSVFNMAPVHQALMEEYTGTWCGYCPRGWAAMEYIKENYPDFITAAYHNDDPMTITTSYPVSVSGFPSASFDRSVLGDPYYGTKTYFTTPPVIGDIMAINNQNTPWALKLSHNWDYDNYLTVNVDFLHIEGFDNESYKIGFLLVSDGLSNADDSNWNQSNYFYSYAPQYIPQLNQFCSGGIYGKSSVKGLVFNDVVVSVDGYKGVSGSVPSSMNADEFSSMTYSWNLDKVSSDLIPDKNKLRVIAFVLNSKGKVLNAAKQDITDFVATGNTTTQGGSAVESIEFDVNAPVEYYNLNGMKVSNPAAGIYIRRHGNATEKVVIK